MSADENNWRTPQFRQSIVAKIDDAIQRSGMATVKKGTEMENHVFQKAKTKEEYLGFVARLILHVQELNKKKAGGGMPGTGGVQDPINALQNLARQGTGNTMLGGLPPPPGPQQTPQSNPEMFLPAAQCMNPRPVLQHKLTTGMPNKFKKVKRNFEFSAGYENNKSNSREEFDYLQDELNNIDVEAAVHAKKRTFTEMCREACGLLKSVNKKLDARDEFQIFGEHVAMKLRSLKSEVSKNVAQYHINTILFEAIAGRYESPVPNDESPPQCGPASYLTPPTSNMSSSQPQTPYQNSSESALHPSTATNDNSEPSSSSTTNSLSTFHNLTKIYDMDLSYDNLLQ